MHSILKHELAKFSCQFAEITRSSTERKIGEKNDSMCCVSSYDEIGPASTGGAAWWETNLTIVY